MSNGAKAAYPHGGFREEGLTKRELFAAMAMQGLIGCRNSWSSEHIAAWAREAADALLAKLEESP